MRPAWLLAIKSAAERRTRTLLLIGAVALSAALITAVASALKSLNASVELRTQVLIGAADVSVRPPGAGQTLPEEVAAIVRANVPDGSVVASRLESSLTTLALQRTVLEPADDGGYQPRERLFVTGAAGNAIQLDAEPLVRPLPLLAGRMPQTGDEIVIDALMAYRLSFEAQVEPTLGLGYDLIDPGAVLGKLDQPDPPAAGVPPDQAEAYNQLLGLALGDQLRVVPSLIGSSTIIDIARAVANPTQLRDQITFLRRPVTLTVVGIAKQPPLGGRPQAYLTLERLQELTRNDGRISGVDIVLPDDASSADPAVVEQTLADALNDALDGNVIVKATSRVTSGLDKNLKSSEFGFLLASILAFLSAAFIVMTGLTTDVAERQRELAIVRCVGGSRWQLAEAQFVLGLIVGGFGALIGAPAGIGVAWAITAAFPEQMPSGLVVPQLGVVLAIVGSVGSGLLGAAWPAWRASRLSPLMAMGSRAKPMRARMLLVMLAAGLAGIAIQLASVSLPADGQTAFWLYVFIGLPAMFLGYFLVSVPAAYTAGQIIGPIVGKLLSLPPRLLPRQVAGSPYRYGFTAGAMMTGLALMVSIWTNGGSLVRDWIEQMDFPDAFVSGLPLQPGANEVLRALPVVQDSNQITREIVQTGPELALGVTSLQSYDTSFIGFEPDAFFRVTNITWVEGSLDDALPKLNQGGYILIAREFQIARGLGVGDRVMLYKNAVPLEFEIAGVVTSPGLDVASRFFNIGEEYAHQSVHAVFGSIEDVRTKLGSDKVHLIQVDLVDGVNESEAMIQITTALRPFGLLDAGSGQDIKDRIRTFASSTLLVFSAVAVVAMLVACFGVANLIVAAIEMRQFEFGVLRAVGAKRALLVRLVLAEAIIIAIVAVIVGTAMGIQASYAGQQLYRKLLGIEFANLPPLVPVLAGWAVVMVLTLAAAWPAVWRLNRKRPRELLAAMKG